MPIIGGVKYSVIRKNGNTYRVPADGSFYVRHLEQSHFHLRIATLVDRIELKIKERGANIKFDRQKFYKAAGLCVFAHRDQKRKISRAPYADHPITLVERAVDLLHILDGEILIAGLLHDVVEDTVYDLGFIQRKFGPAIANLVDGATKIKQMGKNKLFDEGNIDKFVTALTKDIRVLLLKMVDRGINLEDIEYFSDASRERKCEEALDFYVPLGILCGFMKAGRHLADIAFKKLYPEEHREIQARIDKTIVANRQLLEELRARIQKNKNVEILTKPRTVYEVHQIATMRETDAHHLSDIVMMQITVGSVNDCYAMVGVIHSLGIPIDRYWHDYIRDPKINHYQSLHAAVLVDNTLVRFQIRTHEMQRFAQEGVLYKAYSPNGKFCQPDLPWLKADWLRIILQAKDRRSKVLLTKSLSQARLANVLVKGSSTTYTYSDVLLPRAISPLEIAFIADPIIGLHLKAAYHQDVSRNISEPIREGIGFIKLELADEIVGRDCFRLLRNPLARLRLAEYLRKQGEAYQMQYAIRIFESELAKIFLEIGELKGINIEMLGVKLLQMARGEKTAAEVVGEIKEAVRNEDGDILGLGRIELETAEGRPDAIMREISALFSVDGYVRQGRRRRFSFSFRSEAQRIQFGNLLDRLRSETGVAVSSYERVTPPILDRRMFDPDSVFYSHDFALKIAAALQAQKGVVLDLNLDPMLVNMIGEKHLVGLNQIVGEHIATAGVLFLGGEQQNTNSFRMALNQMIGGRIFYSPLLVVFERSGMVESHTIIQQFAHSVDLPPLHITEMGHSSKFILSELAERFQLKSPI